MTDSNPFSTEPWLDAQRKYWDAWMDMTKQASSADAARQVPNDAWAAGLDQWWKAVSPMTTGSTPLLQDFFDKLVGMGKTYFGMAERVAGMPGEGQKAGDAVSDWLDQMRTACDAWGTSLGMQQDPAMSDFMSFWNMPLDTWQRTVSSFSPMPGDFMKALHPEGADAMAGDMREHLDRFLSMPGVGYSRESQEQYQHLTRLVLDYQKAMQDYAIALSKVGVKSTDRFQEKLTEATASNGEPVSSLRDFYNLWVDACEEVYGEYSMSSEYSEMYGEMVNAMMAVKHHGSLLVDETLESMNMPTHREINTLHQRLHEMRRNYRSLREEIDQLRDELKGPSRAATTPAKAPSVKKRATKTTAAGQPAAPKKSTPKKRTVKKTTARKATNKR